MQDCLPSAWSPFPRWSANCFSPPHVLLVPGLPWFPLLNAELSLEHFLSFSAQPLLHILLPGTAASLIYPPFLLQLCCPYLPFLGCAEHQTHLPWQPKRGAPLSLPAFPWLSPKIILHSHPQCQHPDLKQLQHSLFPVHRVPPPQRLLCFAAGTDSDGETVQGQYTCFW